MPTTLVLLHAFPLTSQIYAGQHEALSDVTTLLTPDSRGFGSTPLGGDRPSMDLLADDVIRLLDEHEVDRAVVGGTSMGGYVALAVLRRYPERLAGLILANTKASADAPAARDNRERIAVLVEAAGSVGVLHEELEPKLLGAVAAAQHPELAADVHAMVAGADPAAVAWAQRAMAGRPDSLGALAGCQAPVLVVAGGDDALMSAADAEAMAAAAPRSRLVTLAGVGHLACLERPDAFTAAVRELLAAAG